MSRKAQTSALNLLDFTGVSTKECGCQDQNADTNHIGMKWILQGAWSPEQLDLRNDFAATGSVWVHHKMV